MKKLLKLHYELKHFEHKPNSKGLINSIRANGNHFVRTYFYSRIAGIHAPVVSNKYLAKVLSDERACGNFTPKSKRIYDRTVSNLKHHRTWTYLSHVYTLPKKFVKDMAFVINTYCVEPILGITGFKPKSVKEALNTYEASLSSSDMDLNDGISINNDLDWHIDFVAQYKEWLCEKRIATLAIKNLKKHRFNHVADEKEVFK